MKRSREPEEEISDPTQAASASLYSNSNGGADGLNHPVVHAGDKVTLSPAYKITELDPSENDNNSTGVEMRCSLPPHKEPLVFATYDEYEAHYHKTHTNRCLECRKNFPAAHLLGLHIEENHDSFATVRRERGEHTYACFMETCERKCMTPQKRRMHLIDKHMYPKNFFFAVTRDGIDGRRSLLLEGGHSHRRRSSVTSTAAAAKAAAARAAQNPAAAAAVVAMDKSDGDCTEKKHQGEAMDGVVTAAAAADRPKSPEKAPPPDVEMDNLAGAMSSLQFIPPSIRFGRGGRKAGFSKR
ncbi:hypothetical protein B0T17DRAFT_533904 [Bombardia bombarda]|uniref:C2H2-type domain-containing protein n=1 Tax=Bombardia bombarda TaxID=252184 RepID=A0AA39WTR3_9PEZI|nr:hypothetical protein B0T17DRAFT_533904 [Bombardia bombarda]